MEQCNVKDKFADIKLALEKARIQQSEMIKLTTEQKNSVLLHLAKNIKKNTNHILQANSKDISNAMQKGLATNLIDRLSLNNERIEAMIAGIHNVINLEDEVLKVIDEKTNQANGLNIKRIRVPIGIILMIYESRPNVAIDASILCFKSANGVVLKCGSDSLETSSYLFDLWLKSFDDAGLGEFKECFLLLNPKDRELTGQVLHLDSLIDLVIPRGGKSLVKFISENSKIPLLKHLDGNCHLYIHSKANLSRALDVLINAKMRRTSVCGATESLIVDKEIAKFFIPMAIKALKENNCEIVACKETLNIEPSVKEARDDDYYTEFLDSKISIKIIDNLDAAINHINKYSSHHTDSIITEDKEAADTFVKCVDSAITMHNASTQFADGGELGLGAEIGISTNKLHARGPVALEGLTTYKFVVTGDYSLRK
jgi:glutamate-5-semialdehyde dehydrogenase